MNYQIVFGVVLLILFSGCTDVLNDSKNKDLEAQVSKLENEKSNLNSQITLLQNDNATFTKEYAIALMNINVSTTLIGLASQNLTLANDYASGEYYVDLVNPYFYLATEQATDGEELLLKAKKKLESLNGKAPNPFLESDLKNRIKQADALLAYAADVKKLSSYAKNMIAEINNDEEARSEEYRTKYNETILVFNQHLKELSDIQNQIDLEWDQDWYVVYQQSDVNANI